MIKSIKIKQLILIATLLILITNIAAAGIEIRGSKATGQASWNAQSFAGFWYDIEADKSTESLIVRGSINDYNRFIEPGNLQYTTFDTDVPFRVYSAKGLTVDGKTSYYAIGWQGQKYIAINGKANKLSKLVLEQESQESKVLGVGQTWDMGDGYKLTVQSIDAKAYPQQAWVVLSKDGIKLDDKVIVQGQIYTYAEKSIAGETNVPIFVTYINNIYSGPASNVVELKYSWLISKSILTIQSGDKYGTFKVSTANDNNIALINDQRVQLLKGASVDLMGNIKFKVADSDSLTYYPVIRLQESDKYAIRGELAKGTASWNANNFAGFWYDLDSDQSTEILTLSSFNAINNFIETNSLTYRTQGVPAKYKVTSVKGISVGSKNYYKAVGWQGDKYIAINGKSNKLAKILLEHGASTSEKKSLTVGETWDIGYGYTITAQSIDARASPRQAWLVFSKNGKKLDDKVVAQGQIYTYEAYFGDEGYVPILVTYIDSIFAGATSDMVQLRYTFLASDSAGNIRLGDRFGVFEVTGSNSDSVVLVNKNRIPLNSGTIDLMGGLKFKIANSGSNLRFYPVIEKSMSGESLSISGGSEITSTSTPRLPATYTPNYSNNSSSNKSITFLVILLVVLVVFLRVVYHFLKPKKVDSKADTSKGDTIPIPKVDKPKSKHGKKEITVPETPRKIENTYTLILEIKSKYNKTPLWKATAILESTNGDLIERVSDIDGKAIFGKVREGWYKLRINSKGFEEEKLELDINKTDKIVIELGGKASLQISVHEYANERPLSGAEVKLGEMSFKTDEKGDAVIPDIALGIHDISVQKESYKTEVMSLDVNDIKLNKKIYLKPEINLDEELKAIGENIKKSLHESMKKLSSSCDMCIPEHYKGICTEIIRLIETIATTPAYLDSDPSKEKIYDLYFVAEKITKEMETTLTNEENISDFINMRYKASGKAEVSINMAEYNQMIHLYMTNPEEFVDKFKTDVLNKLQLVDREITGSIQNYNVSPVANLWAVSHKLIQIETKDKSKEGALLLFGNILLDKTREMFKKEEIIKRIRK